MQKSLEKYIPKVTQNKYLLYMQQANFTKFYEMNNSNLIQAQKCKKGENSGIYSLGAFLTLILKLEKIGTRKLQVNLFWEHDAKILNKTLAK